MNPGPAHHALAAVLVILVPILGVLQHRHLVDQVRVGSGTARMRAYRRLLVAEWILALVALATLASGHGDLAGSGIRVPPTLRFWIGSAVALVLCALLVVQTMMLARNPEKLLAARSQIEPIEQLLPHDDREGRAFGVLSVTAGICEEIVYRGFLLTYLQAYFDPWIAVALSSMAFGLGHTYQGFRGILKTGAIGVVFGVLAAATGSIVPAIVLHSAIDLTSGIAARKALETVPPPDKAVHARSDGSREDVRDDQR